MRKAPSSSWNLESQIDAIKEDIEAFKDRHPHSLPVFINLLPAGIQMNLTEIRELSQLYSIVDPERFPDLAYTMAAILSGVPVVNFTSNHVEIPAVANEAVERSVPMSGRDGKTGQTYLKVVLASALKARNFLVDGWYSLNLLGNADGISISISIPDDFDLCQRRKKYAVFV